MISYEMVMGRHMIPIVLRPSPPSVMKFARTTMWSGGPQGRDDGVGLVDDSRGEAFF